MTKDEATARSAMKLALEALNTTESDCGSRAWEREQEAITALREALAQERSSDEQPAQRKPVAWYDEEYDCAYTAAELDGGNVDGLLPLYTSPPAQPSKPLTPEWIWTWLMDWCKRNGSSPANYNSLFKMVADARAIEAAHGIYAFAELKENT